MKNKKIILTFGLILNLSIFYLMGYIFTSYYKQLLDSSYNQAITQAYKYISDMETRIFRYT